MLTPTTCCPKFTFRLPVMLPAATFPSTYVGGVAPRSAYVAEPKVGIVGVGAPTT